MGATPCRVSEAGPGAAGKGGRVWGRVRGATFGRTRRSTPRMASGARQPGPVVWWPVVLWPVVLWKGSAPLGGGHSRPAPASKDRSVSRRRTLSRPRLATVLPFLSVIGHALPGLHLLPLPRHGPGGPSPPRGDPGPPGVGVAEPEAGVVAPPSLPPPSTGRIPGLASRYGLGRCGGNRAGRARGTLPALDAGDAPAAAEGRSLRPTGLPAPGGRLMDSRPGEATWDAS